MARLAARRHEQQAEAARPDAGELEAEIDGLVHAFYGLTVDGIAVVEG